MAAGAPWSVKGIDPKAREVAKDLARRSGMTLGEWLNRVILEDDVPEDVTSEDHFAERAQRSYTDTARPRLVSVTPAASRTDDLARVAHALDRLTDRIEASETRTGLAISGVEHSVRQAVARIETTEREHVMVAQRLETEQASVSERLRRMENDVAGPRSAEAMRVLEQRVGRAEALSGGDPAMLIDEVVSRLGQRLADAEGRTAEALESLRTSLASLDGRLRSVEDEPAEGQRFETLAASLTQRVEDARARIVASLSDTTAGRVDERFAELAAQVQASEKRSAEAIQRMGREVLGMAEALNRRLQSSEQQSAEAIAKVGGEMARVAGAMEGRLGRAEQVQAEALEKLGAEISKITERLSERMLVSERRAAEAIDSVGDQVARVTERLEQRHDRAADELADRIRLSEERTTRLLDEVRARFDPAPAEPVAAVAPAMPAADAPAPSSAAFGPELFSRAELEDEVPAAGRDLLGAAEFAPIPEPAEDLFDLDQPAPPIAELEADIRPLSTREVIEQARAAARAAGLASAAEAPTMEIKAKARWRTTGKAKPGLFGAPKSRGPNSSLHTAMMLAGGAAFLAVGSAGVVLMEGPPSLPSSVQSPAFGSIHASPRAAIALAPQALGPVTPIPEGATPAPAAAPKAQAAPDALVDAYVNAVKGVEGGTPGALGKLKAIADAGNAPAQAYLGKLYETGDHGVAKNMAEARRWTQAAAEGGDPAAMHNLALYDFRGEGGPQDLTSAVRWFRKAADQGIVDSQYNLGLLYQTGSGAPRDLAEAYKWFSIAADGGDGQARANAVDLEGKLSKAQLAQAQQAIDAYRPGGQAVQMASARAPSPALSAAQRILARLGYYKGPVDGAATAKTKTAVAAYQRDQGLAATGALDQNTAARLAVFNR